MNIFVKIIATSLVLAIVCGVAALTAERDSAKERWGWRGYIASVCAVAVTGLSWVWLQ